MFASQNGPVHAASDSVRIVPANEANCADLRTVFGSRGAAAGCQCQRYKLGPGEAFAKFPVEERAHRLRVQTSCGDPDAASTSGLVAYLDDEPVGWCAVEPRPAYQGLLRVYRTPWEGRSEEKGDETIWAVTCVFTRAGYRRRGIGYALANAAVDYARAAGARALEAYPMITDPGADITWGELHMGTVSVFEAAGMTEVIRPSPRRAVMRIEFSDS
jgi:GNAT superfamily N-acetyltransferase